GELATPVTTVLLGADLADLDLDGRLDVLPRHHLDRDMRAWIFLARPDGTWVEAGRDLIGEPAGDAFATLVTDLDGAGGADLFLLFDGSRGRPARHLHRDAGWPPAFRELVSEPHLFGDGADTHELMAGLAADPDGDGRLELFLTDIGPQHLL